MSPRFPIRTSWGKRFYPDFIRCVVSRVPDRVAPMTSTLPFPASPNPSPFLVRVVFVGMGWDAALTFPFHLSSSAVRHVTCEIPPLRSLLLSSPLLSSPLLSTPIPHPHPSLRGHNDRQDQPRHVSVGCRLPRVHCVLVGVFIKQVGR